MTDQDCIKTLEFMMETAEARLNFTTRQEGTGGFPLELLDVRMLARRDYALARAALIVLRKEMKEEGQS